jgi:acyl-CoA thioester hydrolase
MREHQIDVRVRYSETDQMGVVYHANYLPYFEVGRVEWLRNQGISYKSMEENGVALPIVNINISYQKPARYDDLLTVVTKFKNQSSVKIEFECRISNEKGELLTTAEFILVFVDIQTGKPVIPPANIKTIIDQVKSESN